MNNLRDLLGYALDLVDVLVVRHRKYGYCQLVGRVFAADETAVSRAIEPVFQRFLDR